MCEKNKSLEFKGVVIRSYNDFDNKGVFTAEIKTQNEVIKYTKWHTIEPIWIFLEDNDSIVKTKNTFDFKIYKNRKPNDMVFINGYTSCDSIYMR